MTSNQELAVRPLAIKISYKYTPVRQGALLPTGHEKGKGNSSDMKANTESERVEKVGRDKGHPHRTANKILFLLFEKV